MTWIEAHTTLRAHPKVRKLQRRLEVDTAAAIGHLILLWTWAVDYALEGDLSDIDAEDIAIAALFDGDHDLFLEALIECGWVDRDGDRLLLHDWDEYAGKLVEIRRKRSEAGRRGAEARWHPDSKGMANASQSDADGMATNSTVPRPRPDQKIRGQNGRFESVCKVVKATLKEDGEDEDRIDIAVEALHDQLLKGKPIERPVDYTRAILRRGDMAP